MDAHLERARGAYEHRAWASAYELFAGDQSLDTEDLERLSVAAFLIGRDDECVDALERAYRQHTEPGNAARCAFWMGFALMLKGEMARAGGWLGRAAQRVEEAGDCVTRGYLLIPAAIEATESGDPARGAALGAETVEIARQFSDPDLLALGALVCGETAIALGDTTRGLAQLDEVMIAVTSGETSPIPSGILYCAVIEACMVAFDVRRATEWTAALQRWCDSQPDLVPFRGQCLVHRSQVLQAHGDWADAVSEARRAQVRLSQPPHPAVGIAHYQAAELHRLRGDFASAEQAYRDAARSGRDPAPGFALLRLAEGMNERAVAAINRALDERRSPIQRLGLLAAAVDIMVTAGEIDAARRSSEELSRVAESIDAPLVEAMAAFAAGAIGLADGDERHALTELRRACEIWQALVMPYEVARTRVLLAHALRALGDVDAADVELDAAREEFERLGAAPDLARLSAPSTPLTERECEVLRMVAAGHTNRAIGTDLSISEHTVARHVQNIFTKLGLTSRAAATAYAYEHGLVRGQN